MNIKPCIITIALVLLAGCNTLTEMSNMRTSTKERLTNYSLDVPDKKSESIVLSKGLANALRTAVSTNEGYLAALALETEALDEIGVVASGLRPQVTGSANIGGIRETDTNAATTTGVAARLNLSQLVYDGGALGSAINRTTAIALSAQAGRLTQGNEIALRAAQAWIDLWQYSERLRLMQTRTSEMDTLVEQIERMANNGMLDKALLQNAQSQIVDIKLEESLLIAGQAEARVLFQQFFKSKQTNVSKPNDLFSVADARSLVQEWQSAPDLQRQAAELLAAQAAVGEVESTFMPRAQLQAGALSPMKNGESTDLTLGLSLEYNFNDGGRRNKQLEAAKARVLAIDAQLGYSQRGLEAELQAGLTKLDSIERAMPMLTNKLRLSHLEAKTSRSQMQTGQSNLRELVEAEIMIYRAQDKQIAMHAERQILLLTIAARQGALSQIIGLGD
jgi:outer membrane protein, adhesin transport system